MLTIEVTFLTGRYVATAHHAREMAEWPPHPARLYSALVAAWAETDRPSDVERALLIQLESLDAPQIVASPASVRSVVTHYVPVNDASVLGDTSGRANKVAEAARVLATEQARPRPTAQVVARLEKALARSRDVSTMVSRAGNTPVANARELLPDGRGKQARHYPSATPEISTVAFRWPNATLGADDVAVLDRLLERVTRLGHSSSLVSCRLVDHSATEASFHPDPDGDVIVRVPGRGQLDTLIELFAQHRASKPRALPARGVRYHGPSASVPMSSGYVGGREMFVVAIRPADRRLPATRAVDVATALRATMMTHADDPIHELLSGHTRDGGVSQRAHTSFVVLPDVGHAHAHGRILGAAVVLPLRADGDDADYRELRSQVLRALGRWRDDGGGLRMRGGQEVSCRMTDDGDTTLGLRPQTWSRPSAAWVSATPVALARHPGKRRRRDANSAVEGRIDAIVRQACAHAGLPEPAEVATSTAGFIAGVTGAPKYPRFRQFDRTHQQGIARALVHVAVRFEALVKGPLTIGAGRYRGLGLLRPVATTDQGGPW